MDATLITAFGQLLDVLARIYKTTLDRDEKAAYLMAVDDLPFEAVQYACREVFRTEKRMPVPAIIREYAQAYRTEQRQREAQAQQSQISQRTETTDEDGMQAIRTIQRLLEAKMDMARPTLPLIKDEEERERLIAQGLLNPPDPRRWLPLTEDFGAEKRGGTPKPEETA